MRARDSSDEHYDYDKFHHHDNHHDYDHDHDDEYHDYDTVREPRTTLLRRKYLQHGRAVLVGNLYRLREFRTALLRREYVHGLRVGVRRRELRPLR